MQKHDIQIKKLPNLQALPLPSYSTISSAGMDLHAAITAPILLKPFERAIIPNGIAVALPRHCEAQVRSRSGLAAKNGVIVLNSPGTIDADYRGEVCTILINLGAEDFIVEPGMRIAQMVIANYVRAQWNIVEELGETIRGTGGFGSTGIDQKIAS